MIKDVIVTDEYIKGNVVSVKHYMIQELIRQRNDKDIDDEMLFYNVCRCNDLFEKLKMEHDRTEIIVREYPIMGNLEYEIVGYE